MLLFLMIYLVACFFFKGNIDRSMIQFSVTYLITGFFFIRSVMYILCNEEPLWMSLCLKGTFGLLQYKGSWKKTALQQYVSEHVL